MDKQAEAYKNRNQSNKGSFDTHLECSKTGEHYPVGVLHGLSRAGAPLIVRYDLKALGDKLSKQALAQRPEISNAVDETKFEKGRSGRLLDFLV